VDERLQLEAMVQGGKVAVRKIKRAQVLLAADQGSTDEAIARNVAADTSTVYRTKQRFVEEDLERALSELPRRGAPRKVEVGDEAMLCAVACSARRAGWQVVRVPDDALQGRSTRSRQDCRGELTLVAAVTAPEGRGTPPHWRPYCKVGV
jgi:hypothetical protein